MYWLALVQGRIQQTEGAEELNRALRQVLAGLWAQIDGDHLVAEFELLATDTQLQARWNLSEEGTPRLTLPFERVRSGLSQTRTQTKVNRCLTEGRARLREMQPAVLT